MLYGNIDFRRWFRLCVFYVSVFYAVSVGAATASKSLTTAYKSGAKLTWTATWGPPAADGFVTVTFQFTGTSGYTGNPYDPGASGTLSLEGSTGVTHGLTGGKTLDVSFTRKVLPGSVFYLTFYLQGDVRRQDTLTITDEATRYRRLDFALTNSTAQVVVVGVERKAEPGLAFHPCAVNGTAGASAFVKVGAEVQVSLYLAYSDSNEYRVAFEDPAQERVIYQGVSQKLGYDRADGSRSLYFSGWCSHAAPIGGWVPASSGETVTAIPPFSGDGTTSGPATPLAPDAKHVADGSANPATGKEVTDSANAVMDQAHADALGMQKSVDAVRGALEKSDGPAEAAKATKTAMGDGTKAQGEATGIATGYGDSMRTNAAGVVGQFGTAPTIQDESPIAPQDEVPLNGGGTFYQFAEGGKKKGGGTVRAAAAGGISPNTPTAFMTNPFSANGPFGGAVKLVAFWTRKLIAWGMVVAFFGYAMRRLTAMCAAPMAVAPFGDSIMTSVNSIKVLGSGGGIGYAAKLAGYAAAAAIILTMPTAVMATLTAGLPWSSFVSTFTAGPGTVGDGSSFLREAVWYADQILPWKMCISMPLYYFVVNSILFPSQLFWSMFIKFLPL